MCTKSLIVGLLAVSLLADCGSIARKETVPDAWAAQAAVAGLPVVS
jgi:hypothetical protein